VSRPPDDDRELDAFLTRASALQRQWREASAEEPDAAVDASLRAQARRAVSARPGEPRPDAPRASVSSSARWRLPLAAAATLVLGSTIVLMMAERDAHLPATAPAQQQAPVQAPESAAPPHEAGNTEAAQDLSEQPIARKSAPPPRAAAPAPPRESDAAESNRIEPPANVVQLQQAPAAPAPSTTSEDALGAAPAEPQARQRVQSFARSASRPAAGEAAATAPARADAGEEQEDIDAWLERIRALRRQGKLQEAERSLHEFRLRHPDHVLPEDLGEGRAAGSGGA